MDGFSRRASGLWVRKAEPRPKFCSLYAGTHLSGFGALGASRDPYFASVSLLLHMIGPAGSTTFTDSSKNALSITAEGDAKVSTLNPHFPPSCLTIDGTGDDLLLPTDTGNLDLDGDFTVETWLKSAVSTAAHVIIADGGTEGIYLSAAGPLSVYDGTASNNGTKLLDDDVWHHVAHVRAGSTNYMFTDGVMEVTWSNSVTYNYSAQRIGFQSSSAYFNGQMQEFRITKGVARYTTNFAVPSAPFPNR